MFKLEKNIKFYKFQFDDLILERYETHVVDRLAIDIDSLIFLARYLIKKNKDLDKLENIEKEFSEKSSAMRKVFGEMIRYLLIDKLRLGNKNDIVDILVKDMKIDTINISFMIILISENESFLKEIDNTIEDDKIYNLYPDKFFRFTTDSYNDGIAKAYPELFAERNNDTKGVGRDHDVFVHSLTLQTSEACSLQCCARGTKILVPEKSNRRVFVSHKNIEDIQIGDKVFAVKEFSDSIPTELRETTVTKLFRNRGTCYRLHHKLLDKDLFITSEHPVLTQSGDWKYIRDISKDDKIVIISNGVLMAVDNISIEEDKVQDVFNFETTEHTYIADNVVVHNCSYCISEDSLIPKANGVVSFIKDIKKGDKVLAFDESIGDKKSKLNAKEIDPSLWAEVTKVMHRTVKGYYQISHKRFRKPFKVTGEHPILTEYGWMEACLLNYDYGIAYLNGFNQVEFIRDYKINWVNEEIEVYNLETSKSTYIANNILIHNCYQFNKTPMKMDFSTAKDFIDKLLNDEYGYINRFNSPAIILEFIGGEPLLEINLTRKIYEYFLDKCYELNHPWFKLHRVSICSNGMQYFDKEVQDFFKEYANNISFNISIDGNKELHDACRKQPNGEGSYDIDMLALNHYNKYFTPERNSKMTLAPQNMKYLFESVKSFINNGMNTINLNCVFEEGWNRSTALLEYKELKKLADYILENDLENLYISIFNERQEDVQEKSVDGNFCGAGSASMLAVRPNGQFYPCIRYMPTSIGSDKDDLCMGTVDTRLIGREEGSEIIKMLDRNTRRGQVNDICYNCPIGNDCPSCSALGITVFNDNNKKVTFICIQMIAEALANVYYWNLLSIKHPEYNLPVRKNNIPDEWSLLVIDKEELDFLKKIEIMAIIKKIEENR